MAESRSSRNSVVLLRNVLKEESKLDLTGERERSYKKASCVVFLLIYLIKIYYYIIFTVICAILFSQ